jgi:hypothetical protein
MSRVCLCLPFLIVIIDYALFIFNVSKRKTNCNSLMVTVSLHVQTKIIRDFSICTVSNSMRFSSSVRFVNVAFTFLLRIQFFKHNRPLWVAVQGLIRPTSYTYKNTVSMENTFPLYISSLNCAFLFIYFLCSFYLLCISNGCP